MGSTRGNLSSRRCSDSAPDSVLMACSSRPGVVPEVAIQLADVGEDLPEELFAPGPDGDSFEVGDGEGG